MAEYIEREEAMFRLSKWLEKASDINNRGLYNFGEIAAYQTSIFEINSIPAADVKPVVRGTWVYDDETGEICCSECGRITNDRHDEIQEFDGKKVIALCYPRYCGFCGADMRGEKDDKAENP